MASWDEVSLRPSQRQVCGHVSQGCSSSGSLPGRGARYEKPRGGGAGREATARPILWNEGIPSYWMPETQPRQEGAVRKQSEPSQAASHGALERPELFSPPVSLLHF